MRIGLDMDETLSDLLTPLLWRYNQKSGDALKKSELSEYDVGEAVRPEFRQWIYDQFGDPFLYTLAAPDPGAQKAVRELIDLGHTVFVVSKINPYWDTVEAKAIWLARNFPEIPAANYIFCSQKQFIDVNILVDDCADHIRGLRHQTGICLRKPWNAGIDLNGGWSARDWPEVVALVESLGKTLVNH